MQRIVTSQRHEFNEHLTAEGGTLTHARDKLEQKERQIQELKDRVADLSHKATDAHNTAAYHSHNAEVRIRDFEDNARKAAQAQEERLIAEQERRLTEIRAQDRHEAHNEVSQLKALIAALEDQNRKLQLMVEQDKSRTTERESS